MFIGDVAKGAAAALVGLALANPGVWGLAYVGAGAAMVGHAFPVFAHFRGGRSVLTFVGGAAVFAPIPVAIAVVVLLVVFAVTKSFAWGARAGFVVLPFVTLVVQGPVSHGGDGRADVVHRVALRDGQFGRVGQPADTPRSLDS